MKNNIIIDKSIKKVLIIGANGFLGTNVIQFRNSKENIYQNLFLIASDVRKDHIFQDIPFFYIDITNKEKTINKIIEISPQIIILIAAMTNVDQCEIDKAHATKINVEGPKNVIDACKKPNLSSYFFLLILYLMELKKMDHI